jgi:hypothetical protein
MSGRHAGQTATRKRLVRIATVSAVAAVPLGVVAAGAASADTTSPLDTSAVTGLLGGSDSGSGSLLGNLPVVGSLPVVGGLVGTVTGAAGSVSSDTPAAGVLSSASNDSSGLPVVGGLLSNTPAAGVLGTVTGLASNGPASGVLGTVTGLTSGGGAAGVGGLVGGLTSGGLGGVVNGLGLQGVTDTLKPVTDTVNGLLNGVTGNGGLLGLGNITNGLLGGLLGGGGNACATDDNGGHHSGGGNNDGYENEALPHTGGNSDMTALLLCSGLGMAGAGVTLVARRRGGLGA